MTIHDNHRYELTQGVDELKKHMTAAIDDTIPTVFVIIPKLSKPELKQLAEAADEVTICLYNWKI